MMETLLICLGALLALFGGAYMAACGAAQRWLTLHEWWGSW